MKREEGRGKRERAGRTGSALLIVLGMLAFMVISAVGFSVYMRQSRAPSSYLRRNISSRYLVKAALANAIEDLEGGYNEDDGIGSNPLWGGRDDDSYSLQNHFYGIYDDPYPGCGPDNEEAGTDVHRNGDYWLKRVFCPFGPVHEPMNMNDALDEGKQNPTVPTLTLEALAYLPPAIVDDVRKVSRLTRTACWRPLPYDAGRFAYTAVNVSDLFDINRLQADGPRNSGQDRISLISLCSQNYDAPLAISSGDAQNLHDAARKWESSSLDAPCVSLADFALLNAGTPYSPFTSFIGGGSGALLTGSDPKEANALFITDTWFPPTNTPAGQVTFDLCGGHQPFKVGTFGPSGAANSFLQVLLQKNTTDNAGEVFEKNLGIGLACLYDYLDRDSYPISLCLPTTEAVPMIVGVSAPAGLQPQFGQIGGSLEGQWTISGTVPSPDGTPQPAQAQVRRTCKKLGITSFGNQAMVKILSTFPFKRMATSKRAKNYTVRGLMRVYLAKDGMRSRLAGNSKIRATSRSTWQNGSVVDGVATFISDEKQITAFSSDVSDSLSAVDDSVTLNFSNLSTAMPVYWNVSEEYGTITPSGAFTPDNADDAPRANFNSLGLLSAETETLRPLDGEGNFYNRWDANGPWDPNVKGEAGAKDMSGAAVASGGDTFRYQVALWIQVLDGTEVVDMVPACVADDNEWCNAGLPDNNDIGIKCGSGVPLLNFTAKDDVDYKNGQSDFEKPVTFDKCASLYAVDPRYNFAPENWYATDDLQVMKNTWLDFLKQNYFGKDVNGVLRDRDIFMFVSDQEYLQDIGELQFLPYLQEMAGSAAFLGGDYAPDFNGNPFSMRKDAGAAFANKGNFWRTYTAYNAGDGYDPIYSLPYSGYPNGVRFHSGFGAFKLNPYSDDDRVLYAALAGTPYDYYIASTNEDSEVKKVQDISLSQMISTYSFGENAKARITNDEMMDIASAIRNNLQSFAEKGRSDWMSAWRDLQWQEDNTTEVGDENKRFFGVDLSSPLHGVDRKFLYSFWRECFDNRQQLFLIFVRAEPASVGGGASGSLSSAQLGGRAVALVWRDPAVPSYNISQRKSRSEFRGSGKGTKEAFREMKKDCPSHRTRVLFYHQFD